MVFEQASCARQEIDLLLICVKRSFLLWMRRSRGRDRPQICGRYHEGLAGQGNISGLNQITYIDWEDQTYSRNLISGWNSLRVQIGPPFSCYSTSALGSPSSSASLQVHLGRGGASLSILLHYIPLSISYLLIFLAPPIIMFWFHGYESGACFRSKHQEVILPIHQVKIYSIIIITALIWTRTRN